MYLVVAPAAPPNSAPPIPYGPSRIKPTAVANFQPWSLSSISLCPYHAQGFAIRLKPWPPSPKRACNCCRTSPVIRSAVVGESPKWITVAAASGACASSFASAA